MDFFGRWFVRCWALIACFVGMLSSVVAAPFEGCPDFMDITAPHVDAYHGMMSEPFDTLGLIPSRHHLNEEQGYDINTGNRLKFIPEGELKSIRLGNDSIGGQSEAIVYHYVVDPDNSLLFVNFAVVLEDPGHEFVFQPRFTIRITDKDGKLVNDCSVYDVTAAAGLEGFHDYLTPYGSMVRWRDWTKVGLDLTPFVGKEVQVQFITYDCFLLGHFGYAYFTASCAPNKLSLDVCEGGTFSLAAPAGFPSYRWDNGDTSRVSVRTYHGGDMNIYCEVTSVTGCQFTQSAFVTDTNPAIEHYLKDTICQGESYSKNNFDLPAQMNVGTFGYTNVLLNPNTCTTSAEQDLELTILQTYYPIEASICEGDDYVENGFHIIRPPVGVLLDTLRYERGEGMCDSVVCLRLVVSDTKNLSNEIKGEQHPCTNQVSTYYLDTDDNLSRYTWTLPENVKVVSGEHSPQIVLYFTDATPATLTIVGENGCGTSAVPYTIYPNPSYHDVLYDTVCVGESYVNGEIRLEKQMEAGQFTSTYSLKTKSGCDSTVILKLTVLANPVVSVEVSPEKKIYCDSSEVKLSVRTEGSTPILHQCPRSALSIGDVYCSDGTYVSIDSFAVSGKKAAGVVYFYDDAEGYAYIVSLEEPNPDVWTSNEYDIPSLENQQYLRLLLSDMDGYGHTSLMRAEGGFDMFPMAWNVDYEHGWYIPAIGELRKIFGSINTVNYSLRALGGDTVTYNFDDAINLGYYYYASSSEYNDVMICAVNSSTYIYATYKYSSLHFRFTKKEKLQDWTEPKVKMGDVVQLSDGAMGVVLSVDPDGKTGTMVALRDVDSIQIESLFYPQTVPNMPDDNSIYQMACGYDNTKAYVMNGDSSMYPAAWSVGFQDGWYIPSAAEMNYLYVNAPLIDDVLYDNGGDPLSYDDYWTSTGYTTYYGCVFSMTQGNPMVSMYTDAFPIRPMRRFTVCEEYVEYLNASCSFKWSTGDTSHVIVVRPRENTSYSVNVTSNVGGCSTSVEKPLYVQSNEPIVLNRSICHGQTYHDDYFDVSEAGTYETEVDNGECKQKVVLNLNVWETRDTSYVEDVACQGSVYKKYGFQLVASQPGVSFDTITLSNMNGCDSVVCLRLEVSPAQRDTQYARICQNEAYSANDFDIPSAQPVGLKYWERNELAEDGCTVIHVLALKVDSVIQLSMVDSICLYERYQRNGFDFVADEEGFSVHYLTLESSTRCDSIIALSVKAIGHPDYVYYDTVYYNDPYSDANFVLPPQKVSGTHRFDTLYVNSHGCDSLVVLMLHVRSDDDVKIPTSFTPTDGNGINDIFMEGYEIFIHDRYGLLVCHSDNGWDGTYRGEPADAGVYLYTIRFSNGSERHGTVEILKE